MTGGVSLLGFAYGSRQRSIAKQKLKITQSLMNERGWALHRNRARHPESASHRHHEPGHRRLDRCRRQQCYERGRRAMSPARRARSSPPDRCRDRSSRLRTCCELCGRTKPWCRDGRRTGGERRADGRYGKQFGRRHHAACDSRRSVLGYGRWDGIGT